MLSGVAQGAPFNNVHISRLHPVDELCNLLSKLVVHTQIDVARFGE